MGEELLRIEGLRTYYFTVSGVVRAVDGVDVVIREEESVGLIGESGSGKSTLAFSILRIVPPPGRIVGGKILFKGRDLLKLNSEEIRKIRGKEIAMVFQDPSAYLNPVLRIEDQMTEGIILHEHISREEAARRAEEILRKLGIPSPKEVLRYYPHQLSGGMKQRVVIGMAIALNPSLLIADEPTTALDVTIQAQILQLLRELKEELKLSLLLITHDLGIAAEICDRIYIMYAGRICEVADVFKIYDDPLHPYSKKLLSSAVSIYERGKELQFISGEPPDLTKPMKGCPFAPRCEFSQEICFEKRPPPVSMGDRLVYCWLYAGGS